MHPTSPSEWELVGTDPLGDAFHPTFTANGHFGARIPAAGQGYSRHRVETQFQVAGLFAAVEDQGVRREIRAGAPAWTGLRLSDGTGSFDDCFDVTLDAQCRGSVEDYQQVLDLATGEIRTQARWTSPGGNTHDVSYTVVTDRAQDDRALVHLRVTPHQDCELTITDTLDTRAATHVADIRGTCDPLAGTLLLETTLEGTGLRTWEASTLVGPGRREPGATDALGPGSLAQSLVVGAHAAQPLEFTAFLGLVTSLDAEVADTDAGSGPHPSPRHLHPDTQARPRAADLATHAWRISTTAASLGMRALRAGNARAWARLWRGDIRVLGDDLLQQQVRASRFYLLASTSATRPWSPSPAGLSSDGYGGHVFWDTETWMWPSLLAQDPDIARALLQYRADRIGDARRNARDSGDAGIRFPWEGALDGREHTPAIEFGQTELHVISDVALACWQYHMATDDIDWLEHTGAPIIRGAAEFWAGRAELGEDGAYHIRHVTPPDEWAQAHDDSAYTNVAAAQVLRIATRVAALVGQEAPREWTHLADLLHVPHDGRLDITREHADYEGERIKQADVVMLTYPWEHPQDRALTARDLDHYSTKVTEEGGPSMTDAMHAIVSAELGRAEDALWYTRRSATPFLRAPFQQFAEERGGGAFTFVTGAGGFLQEFLHGFTGLRLREDGIVLDPVLPTGLDGIELTGLRYHATTFTLRLGQGSAVVTVDEGPALRVHCGAGVREVAAGTPLTLATRRPVDAGPARGRGRVCAVARLAPAEQVARGVPAHEGDPCARPGGHPEDFEVTSLQVLEDGELTRVVVDVAGEISNPWAGEGMTAQLLHVYLGVPEGTPPGTGAGRVECLPGTGAAARTAQPWQLALVASGLHRGPGAGTGLYDACAHLVSDVDLVVSRRQQIVLTLPTAALGGMDLPQARIFVLMADAVGDAREPGRSGGGFDPVALAALRPRVRCVPGLDLPAGGVAAGAHLVLPALTVEWVDQGS